MRSPLHTEQLTRIVEAVALDLSEDPFLGLASGRETTIQQRTIIY